MRVREQYIYENAAHREVKLMRQHATDGTTSLMKEERPISKSSLS